MQQYDVLGSLEVARDGRPVDVGGHKQRALLAILLIHRNRVVSAERIIDHLWEGQPPASAPGTLQGYLSHLRKALRSAEEDPGNIVTRSPGYVLVVPHGAVDADRFVDLAQAGAAAHAAGDHPTAVELLDDALSLWRGPPFSDFAEQAFAREERVRLEELHAQTIEERMDAGLALGWHTRLVPQLQILTTRHPLRERLRGQLMLALYRGGRQVDALDVYRQGRDHLAQELGIDPGPALQHLEQAILRQDPSLDHVDAGAGTDLDPQDATPRWNIPQPPSPIVGREADVQALNDVLADARLVTLVGPGGTGKTRLAIEVAHGMREAHGDGPWMVELAGLRQPGLVPNALAHALGLVVHGERAVVDVITDALLARPVLLVLDNCEHLLGPVGALVGTLLKRCADLTILATSREPLRVPGEHLYPLAPLPVASRTAEGRMIDGDAMHLFAARAAAVVPGFAITAENRSVVRHICRELDGLPLAVELAASWMRMLSPEQLAERLEDRFAVLAGGGADAEPHERGLRAAVEWSVDLLDDEEQRLFGALSTFTGGFELDGVDRLAAGSPAEVLHRLDALCAKSLVTVDTTVNPRRYGMLATLREYGRQLLPAEEAQALAQRHAEWCADLTVAAERGLRGPGWLAWLRRLEHEQDNIRAALSFALDCGRPALAADIAAPLGWYWFRKGQVDEARQWLERCVAARDQQVSGPWARVVMALGTVRYLAGDIVDARRLGEQAMGLARRCDARVALAESTVYSAYFEAVVDLDAAERRATAGLALARQLAVPTLEAEAVTVLGNLARSQGDLDRAEALLAESIALAHRAGDWWQERIARWTAAKVSLDRGRPDVAVQQLRGVIGDLLAAGDLSGVLVALHTLTAAVVQIHGPAAGAVLLGAVGANAERVGFLPQRIDPLETDDLHEQIRQMLPEEEFTQAVARGRAMRRAELTALVEELSEV